MQIPSTDLRFPAKISIELHKMHFLDNLRTISQDGNMATSQMTHFFIFSSTFYAVLNIHF